MKKIILITLFVLSLIMLSISFYFYKSNDTTERKSRLMRHIIKELKHRSLPLNSFDKKMQMEGEEALLFYGIDFKVSLNQKVDIAKCLNDVASIYNDEENIKCIDSLNNHIIAKIGEKAFIKSIAHSYFTSGIKYLILGDYVKAKHFKETTNENNEYLKLISYSGFLHNLRFPKKLTAFYTKYKPMLHSAISKKLYNKHLATPINNLLEAHQKIESAIDKEAFLEEIYNEASKTYSHSDTENWSITFWNRRNLEKNDKIIYNILTEVKLYYEDK
ncbi:MAG: hypothetical protein L3J08_05680 [Flavobacteriaceae bacterium]|nr:hypothetical protein [Flavobacteriaceae bacterium]